MNEALQFALVVVQAVGTMLAVGLELSPGDLRLALAQRRAIVLGLLISLVLVPLAAVLILVALPLPKAVAAGILLAAAGAGGNSAVLLTRNVGGDTAHAVAMLCALNLLGLITLPPLLGAVSASLQLAPLPATAVALQVLNSLAFYMIGPLVLGMLVRARWPALAVRWAGPVAKLANVCLLALILGLMLTRGSDMLALSLPALAAMLVLVCLSFALPRIVATTSTGLGRAAMHVGGIRNLSLALLVAALLQLPALTTLSVLAYGLLMYLGAGVIWLRQRPAAVRSAA